MKSIQKMLAVMMIVLCVYHGYSQSEIEVVDSSATQTLFSKGSIKKIGLYVAPEIGFGQYAKSFTPIRGVSANFIVNNKWSFGLAVAQTMDRSFAPKDISADQSLSLNVRHLGAKIEYSLSPNKVWHVTIPVKFGLGGFDIDSVNGQLSYDSIFHEGHHGRGTRNGGRGFDFSNNRFSYVAPGLNIEVNVTKFARLYFGAAYNIALSVKNNTGYTNVASSTFSGLQLNVGAKLGIFEYNLKKKESLQ